MSKISDFIERLDKIIKAYEKCDEADSCDGCSYDRICATKSFALENDATDLLADIVCSIKFDRSVCRDICNMFLDIKDWTAKMECGRFIDDGDGLWGGVLCLAPEMEQNLVALLKRLKDMLTEMK